MIEIISVRKHQISSTSESQEKPLKRGRPRHIYGGIFPVQIQEIPPEITGKIQFPPLHKQATPDNIEIGTLPIDALKLRQPIIASIERENDQFIAHFSQVDEYGFGSSPMQAVDDLRMTLLELYLSLKEGKDKLGPGLVETLKELEKFIVEE